MRHCKAITRQPQVATTIVSSLQVKITFMVNLVDRIVTITFNKNGGAV